MGIQQNILNAWKVATWHDVLHTKLTHITVITDMDNIELKAYKVETHLNSNRGLV